MKKKPKKKQPPKSTRGKHAPYHWTLEYACGEFGINPRTLSKNLKQLGTEPAFSNGKFSTIQIANAVYGDMHAKRLRQAEADALAQELANAEKLKQLVDVNSLAAKLDPVMTALKQKVANLPITDALKDDIALSCAELLKKVRE